MVSSIIALCVQSRENYVFRPQLDGGGIASGSGSQFVLLLVLELIENEAREHLWSPSHNLLLPRPASTHLGGVQLSAAEIQTAVRAALVEDVGSGDVTSRATVPASATFSVVMRAREPLVVAGIAFAETAFRSLSRSVRIKQLARDGQAIKADAAILQIVGW